MKMNMKTMRRIGTDGVENKIDTFHQSNDLLGNRLTATPEINLIIDCKIPRVPLHRALSDSIRDAKMGKIPIPNDDRYR